MKILTVDDSDTMRRIIKNGLKAIGYDEVIEAENGQVGLARIQSEAVDFVITDCSMPVMTGLEMLSAIRSNPATRDLPVLMVTAAGRQEEVVEAVLAGVSGYIVKPFAAETLHAKMQQVLGQP
ncbi:MAG: response regulator [Candidatus Rokuibacteriota bacterium]